MQEELKRTIWTSIISSAEWGRIDLNKPSYMTTELPKLLFHECLEQSVSSNRTVQLADKSVLMSIVDELMGDEIEEESKYSYGGRMSSSDVKLIMCACLQSLDLDMDVE